MQPSKDLFDLTESSEGLRLKAYQDTGGVWTIGYGHTKGVKPNQIISLETADALLHLDIQYAVSVVNGHCLPCTQGQFDALTDFVFNVGPSQFLSSHLFTYHKQKAYEKAAAEFPKWKYDNGKIEPGLVARRAKEQELYSRPEQPVDHQRSDEQQHSVSPTVYSAPQCPGPTAFQSSPAPLEPVSNTAQASSTGLSGLLSQASESFRKLIVGLSGSKD